MLVTVPNNTVGLVGQHGSGPMFGGSNDQVEPHSTVLSSGQTILTGHPLVGVVNLNAKSSGAPVGSKVFAQPGLFVGPNPGHGAWTLMSCCTFVVVFHP